MHFKIKARAKTAYLVTAAAAACVAALFLPCFHAVHLESGSYQEVYLNGELVGRADSAQEVDHCLIQARRNLAGDSKEIVYAEQKVTLKPIGTPFGTVSSRQELIDRMTESLKKNRCSTLERAYSVKIGDYMVSLSSISDVQKLLQAALDKYDTSKSYGVDLVRDESCELNVLTAEVYNIEEKKKESQQEASQKNSAAALPQAGIFAALENTYDQANQDRENAAKDFADFKLGLVSMSFDDPIQIVETYMPEKSITGLDQAVADVTKDQETNQTYEVQSGDTLGEIAEDHNMTIEDLIGMNEILENENSTIRVGDELTISVPEPELSVNRQEEKYYEEDYDAEVQYQDNDSWFTNQTQVLQQPSSGHREVVAMVSYRNNAAVATDILKQEVSVTAVPKIVERGTKIPPTYIWPVSGGHISSGFGRRKAPKRGASTYHEGLDISVPVGTAVMASCGGTVVRAGWGSGYGRLIVLQHPDGRETRYGHLSRILVSAGQTVKQGQKIALSGNTGNSTGPHLHFEIRIGGGAVNPLKYVNG